MELIEAIKNRHSVRQYTKEPIKPELIKANLKSIYTTFFPIH